MDSKKILKTIEKVESVSPRPNRPKLYLAEIPETLKTTGSFCTWNYVWNDREQKWGKIPHNVRTGKYASPKDPDDFVPFAEACRKLPNYDGLGILIFGNLAGIDIDNCIDPETGEISKLCDDVMQIMDCYTERSPSGHGIRLLFTVSDKFFNSIPRDRTEYETKYYTNNIKLPYEADFQHMRLEAYFAGVMGGRFLTITGDTLSSGRDLDDRSDQVIKVLDRYMSKPQVTHPVRPPEQNTSTSYTLTDQEIFNKISRSKGSDKFNRLWAGDWDGYQSVSEADQALCAILAFWTGGDRNRIKYLYAQSNLAQISASKGHGKGLRDSYIEPTITKAIRQCNGSFYNPNFGQHRRLNR